jgi:hypothetical protein
MKEGTVNKRMLKAAAKELNRAHQFWADEFSERWSRGDASMPNVIYDEKTRRARLIDFEIMYEKSLPATARHADERPFRVSISLCPPLGPVGFLRESFNFNS